MFILISAHKKKILTIAIPTYNRLDCLRTLVAALFAQIDATPELAEKVEIMVVDNCSADGTASYIRSVSRACFTPFVHETNRGADFNVRYCFQNARGRYVWIIGDDDLPGNGSILKVLEHVEAAAPDLVYLPVRWIRDDLSLYVDCVSEQGDMEETSALGFAAHAGVHVTFISSIIANKEQYERLVSEYDISRCQETSLPHLEWVFSLLAEGRRFSVGKATWLYATAGNSGGYGPFQVFGENYLRILQDKLHRSDRLRRCLSDAMLNGFLPSLLWKLRSSRAGNFGDFDRKKALQSLNVAYQGSPFYRALIVPIASLPLPIARLFAVVAISSGRVLRASWILRTRLLNARA